MQVKLDDTRRSDHVPMHYPMHYHYFTIEQRNVLAELMRARLAEPGMDTALKRLHAPEFGVCEACGGDIPFVRLQANPRLTHCARCLAER